jgi:hypothetical protein
MQADDNRGIENVSGFDGTSDYVATDGNFDFFHFIAFKSTIPSCLFKR